MKEILEALSQEHSEVDEMVAGLDRSEWRRVTPAEPWTVRDQICHLAFFDEKAALSVSDAAGFMEDLNKSLSEGIEAFLNGHLDRASGMSDAELLSWWRRARRAMLDAFAGAEPELLVPWYGPSMKARSSATARLMEAWAHGTDIADSLGVRREPTARLFHIAELGVKTFGWSFVNRGLDVPPARVRVELAGPGGDMRTWNDSGHDLITGPVEDFCRVVAQRIHVDDTRLVVEGDIARRWMEIAQVFAGPPGPGRPPAASA